MTAQVPSNSENISTTNETDFAKLVGYEEPTFDPTFFNDDNNREKARTVRGVVNSPFSKLGLVAAFGSIVFGAFGFFFYTFVAPSKNTQSTAQPIKDDDVPLVSAPDLKDAEISKFKTDLALGSQTTELLPPVSSTTRTTIDPNKLPLNSSIPTSSLADPSFVPTSKSLPPVRQLQPSPIISSPSSVRQLQPSPIISSPSSVRQLQPSPIISSPPTSFQPRPFISPIRAIRPIQPSPFFLNPATTVKPSEPKDSLKEWQRLATIGSYGSVASPSDKISVPEISKPTIPTTSNNLNNPNVQNFINERIRTNTLSNYVAESARTSVKAIPPNTLLIGTIARASLRTPLVFSTDGSRTIGSAPGLIPKFIVNLDEPIQAADGVILIPANSALIVTARPLDAKSGLSELDVVGIVINGNELIPPTNAITIRGASGTPLIADRYFDRGSAIAGNDIASFFTSALSEVGKLANRPDSTTSISSFGGSSISQTNPARDTFGAALSGGFSSLSDSLKKRNEQYVQELRNSPNVFFIPAGKELQVFINQTVNL